MSRQVTKIIGLLAALACAGCATVRSVDPRNQANILAAVEEGDRITLTTRDFRQYELRVRALSDVAIEGEDEDGEPVVVPYADIESLQVREPRPGRTAGAVAGGVFGAAVVVYAVAVAAVIAVLSGGF